MFELLQEEAQTRNVYAIFFFLKPAAYLRLQKTVLSTKLRGLKFTEQTELSRKKPVLINFIALGRIRYPMGRLKLVSIWKYKPYFSLLEVI